MEKEHVTLEKVYELQLETNDKINGLKVEIELLKVKVALMSIFFSWAAYFVAHFVADKFGM